MFPTIWRHRYYNNSVENIHNQIRAFSPRPGAYTFFNNKRIKLFGSSVAKIKGNKLLKPGYIDYKRPILQIGTKTYPLLISNIQMEGKKRVPVSEFILGVPDMVGENFD